MTQFAGLLTFAMIAYGLLISLGEQAPQSQETTYVVLPDN